MSGHAVSTVPRHVVVIGATLLLVGGLVGCGESGSGDVAARVGGSPITKTTVDHWVSVLAGGGTADRSGSQREALQARALDFLISSQWLLGEAGEVTARASDKEAQAQLELVSYDKREGIPYDGIPRRGELPTLFAKARSHSDRLWLMKLAILTFKVEDKHVKEAEREITRAQIASYYAEHTSSFVLPERRDLRWIVTYSERTLQKATREIRAGKSFLAVAKRASLDPPAITGLELASAEEKDFARHIFAAKPHVLAGPFRQSQNHYMLEVTKVTPARQQTLVQVQASIRRRLATRWAATAVRQQLEVKWSSRTSCRPEYVVSNCRGGPGAGA